MRTVVIFRPTISSKQSKWSLSARMQNAKSKIYTSPATLATSSCRTASEHGSRISSKNGGRYHGYRGLYNGLTAEAIHRGKRLKKTQHIVDHMGTTELVADLFQSTQAEEKLRRDQMQRCRKQGALRGGRGGTPCHC